MTSESPSLTRRRFLALLVHGGWLAATGLFLYQIGRFLGARPLAAAPPPVVVAGQVEEFAPGQPTYVAAARAWVRRDGQSILALDAVCPHLGCLVRQDEAQAGFYCPCHGSRFATDGSLRQGPAERPLRPLVVEVRPEGDVIIRLR